MTCAFYLIRTACFCPN